MFAFEFLRMPRERDRRGGAEDSKPANEPRKGLATEAEAAVAASKVRIVYKLSPPFHSTLLSPILDHIFAYYSYCTTVGT